MNRRFRYWFLPVALAGALSVAALAGVALAQNDSSTENEAESGAEIQAAPSWKDFASRVARILGTDEAQTQNAFEQAAREQHEEALKARLDRLVEAGKLTQEQADAYLNWIKSRPADLPPMLGLGLEGGLMLKGRGHEMRGFGMGHMEHGHHFLRPRGGDRPIYEAPSAEPAPTAY